MAESLIVIGGTAAGLSAASKAKRLRPDMEVTVYERSGFVSYGACGLPYFVGGLIGEPEELISLTADTLREKRNIPTYIHHEVTAIRRKEKLVEVTNLDTGKSFTQYYDKLMIATGAEPILPPLPGVEAQGVHCLRTVEDGIALKARTKEAKQAVIVGGGFIGLETAEELRQAGLSVTVLEALPRFLPFLPEDYSTRIQRELESHGVAVRLGATAAQVEVENGRATGVSLAGGETLPADLVLFSVGVRPSSRLAVECGLELGLRGGIVVDERQRTSDPAIYAAGDCVQMKNLITGEPCYFPLGTTANKQGRVAGENLAGSYSAFPGVLGSQVTNRALRRLHRSDPGAGGKGGLLPRCLLHHQRGPGLLLPRRRGKPPHPGAGPGHRPAAGGPGIGHLHRGRADERPGYRHHRQNDSDGPQRAGPGLFPLGGAGVRPHSHCGQPGPEMCKVKREGK